MLATPAAADQDATVLRVSNGIGDDVPHDALEQQRIGEYPERCGHQRQRKAFRFRGGCEIRNQTGEQFIRWEGSLLCGHGAHVEAGKV